MMIAHHLYLTESALLRHMSRRYPGNYKAHENRGFSGACGNSSHQALLPAPAPEESLGTRLARARCICSVKGHEAKVMRQRWYKRSRGNMQGTKVKWLRSCP